MTGHWFTPTVFSAWMTRAEALISITAWNGVYPKNVILRGKHTRARTYCPCTCTGMHVHTQIYSNRVTWHNQTQFTVREMNKTGICSSPAVSAVWFSLIKPNMWWPSVRCKEKRCSCHGCITQWYTWMKLLLYFFLLTLSVKMHLNFHHNIITD